MGKVKNGTCLILFLAVATSFGQSLHAQERDRQITTFRSGMVENMSKPDGSLTYTHLNVVEVVGFNLAGVPITPGRPFRADDDWLTKLRVKVKNISGTSISHIRMNFALPEEKFVRSYTMGFSLDYKVGARAKLKVLRCGLSSRVTRLSWCA